MTPQQVSALFPPAWQREEEGALTYVSYPDPSRSVELRFEFGPQGLQAIEVGHLPPEGVSLGDFYRQFREQVQQRYGALKVGTGAVWSDGYTVLSLSKGVRRVYVRYRPKR